MMRGKKKKSAPKKMFGDVYYPVLTDEEKRQLIKNYERWKSTLENERVIKFINSEKIRTQRSECFIRKFKLPLQSRLSILKNRITFSDTKGVYV
jgi:hypothetical protein